MIIENEYTRAERKQAEAEALEFEKACNNIINNKKLSKFEKQHELRCIFEDELIDEWRIHEWKIDELIEEIT